MSGRGQWIFEMENRLVIYPEVDFPALQSVHVDTVIHCAST